MSWDLLVAIHDRPVEAPADGELIIGAPVAVELEDLPEVLASAVLSPRFLVEISVPIAATRAARSRAAKRAKEIAEQFRGAVYDPQNDELVWPKQRARPPSAEREEARIRVVQLNWYVAGRKCPPETASDLLAGLRTACPEAVPRRYGDFEPLQHKLAAGGEREFVEFWGRIAAIDFGSSFFWKAQSPCYGGSAFFPDQRATYPNGRPARAPGTRCCTKISFTFDGRVLHRDPRWCEAVVTLLSSLARRLDALYAAAHVERNVIARRSLWYDGASETVPMPHPFFAGLPPVPTWLAWFGPAYAPLVAASLGSSAETSIGGAVLFRGGREPMDTDELAQRFPALPSALTFRTRTDALPGEPRFIVADHIPLP